MDLFKAHGINPRSDLGQNFLIDINLIEFAVRAAELTPNDVVLEVGPGTGGMTTYHRSRAKRNAAGRFGRGRRSQPESRRHFEIAISSTLLFNTTFESQRIKVGGVATFHRLDALQRIFEHELVHLLEMVVWDDSSCARWRFKSIAERFFGHLESNHQLLTPSETARSEYGITSGDMVKFHHKGIQLTGVVNSINRRATVLVASDKGGELFDDNRRYQRFYVPLERLSRVG